MKLPRNKRDETSATITHTLGLILTISGLFVLTALGSPPAWWASRGATHAVEITTNDGIVTTNYITNDYAAVTQGQVKQFTARAVDELNADLSGGAGTNLNTLVSNWVGDYTTNGYNATNIKPSDYTVMNVGQLKYIGNKVWTRLVSSGYTSSAPSWLALNTNTDNQAANVGQLKEIFDFSISSSAAVPTFSPGAGTYSSAQTVTLSSSTSGATIYYTTDGSTPTTGSSSVSSGATITVSTSETIKALAAATGYTNSSVASAAYTIETAAATPTFSPGAGTYTSAQTVTLSSSTSGATIYYTTDGSTPTTGSSSVSSGATITVSTSETIKALAAATGYTNSSVASAAYTIETAAATPTFSPGAGTYTSAQTVTLSSSTSGATIYYTTDGSTPTTGSSSVSSGATITVSSSETVKALAAATGYTNSSVASAAYTIETAAATPTFSPGAGTYTSAQTVTLSSSTSGATIYYTTDGSTPTTGSSSVSSGATITVSTSETVKALAAATGYTNSTVASADYMIHVPPTSGLALWLKTDAGLTSSSGNVTGWADQTSNHNDASPGGSTPPTVITGGLAGYSAVHFDGSGNNYLVITDNSSLDPSNYTILAVAKENSIGSSQYLLCRPYRSGGLFNWSFPYVSYAAMLDQDDTTYLLSTVTTADVEVDNNNANTYSPDQPHEFSWRYDGANQQVYYDGRTTPSTSAATTGDIDYSGGSADLVIGRHSSTDLRGGATGEPLDADVYEILIYNRALSDAEKQQAEVYLADKYGLYNPNATWPLTYSSAVQAEITKHRWTKAQAEAYVTLQASNSSMLTNGLTLWLKADDSGAITLDGSGNVSSWADETGNYTFSQSNSSDRPAYVSSDLDGKPGLRFGGSQWLSNSSFPDPGLNADMTIITVGMTTSPSSQTYAIEMGQNTTTGANRALGYYGGNELFDTDYIYCSGGTAPTSGTFLAEVTTLDRARSNVAFYQNGAVTGAGGLSGVLQLSSGITVGAASGGSNAWQGDIVEQLVYDHKLSPAELQQVSLYLANKYGLAYNAAVDISPSGGSYTSSQTVSMSTAISGGTIHYTVDGSQPTASSPTYTSSITVSASALVQAVVTVSGTIESPVVAAQYYINDSGDTGLPIAPTSLTATLISGSETDLAWTLSGMVNYDAINIYRSTNGGSYVLIDVLDPTATSYADLTVVAGNSYTYEVGTLNQSGISDTSASSAITPPASTTLTITVTTPSGATDLP